MYASMRPLSQANATFPADRINTVALCPSQSEHTFRTSRHVCYTLFYQHAISYFEFDIQRSVHRDNFLQ